MKYPKQQFELLVSGLKVLVNHWGGLTKEICSQRFMLHDLHFRVYVNYDYPNTNPNVILGKDDIRILPLTSFDLYPNNCVDDNIETAMKAALKIVFI